MERLKQNIVKEISKLVMVILIIFAYSCSEETIVLQDDLEKKSGKLNTSDLKTLVRGAALNSANGIDIGPEDGNLYVASVQGQEIAVIDKNNGKIISRIMDKNPNGAVREDITSPDDLVWSPDGKALYWTNILTGEVGRLKDGEFKKQFVAFGVNPIAFNAEGRLFVALDFLGDGLYEIDPELDAGPIPIIECPTGFCLGFFNSFDFGTDGYLYGPLFALGQVIKMNVDTGEYTTVATGFVNPAAAKFGPDGLLTVIDQTGEIWKVNPNAVDDKTLFTTLQPGLDNIVFDEDGSLYITNADEGWVAEILPSGKSRLLSPGGMIVPQGIAVMTGPNSKDMIFEADLFSLRSFDGSNGQQEDKFKGFLVPPPGVTDPLTLPQNVSASGSELVISSFFNSIVQIWNPEEGVTEEFEDQVAAPIDAVRLNSGEVIVSDIGRDGVFSMNDPAFNIQTLFAASGLATDGESVWAADWGSGVIYKIDFAGVTPTSEPVFSGLFGPEGLALDNEERLLVFETGGPLSGDPRLSRIDFSQQPPVRTTIVDGLKPKKGGIEGFPPMWFFDGVDVGANGDIYLTGGEDNVIHKIPQSKVK
ncbi:hypothetical protein [Lutimonas vermicola]|uniref:SMP-30/Gluconolactonase/LRE-like region domain-containing protein n=1 Tax=Lutimonas vermicola TaxID=414288 RepID=A0ABU9L2C6_9FLAO